MSDPFMAEIVMIGCNFAPRAWANCDGQILPINQNQSLYSLLGTTYGGDGRTSFALPDMRGRAPMHAGDGSGLTPRALAAKTGAEKVTLVTANLPSHNHTVSVGIADGGANTDVGNNNPLSNGAAVNINDSTNVAIGSLGATSYSNTGQGGAHENMQPWICVRFIICLQGLFPSRN